MAARLTTRQKENTCAAIKATHLIKRLQEFTDGEIELSATQVRAIEILLDRTVPKLAQIQHVGDAERPIVVQWQQPTL
jgi:hypothetical protein